MYKLRITLQAIIVLLYLIPNISFASNTIKITDAFGQLITVPADAKRIICLSEIDYDSALALNVN